MNPLPPDHDEEKKKRGKNFDRKNLPLPPVVDLRKLVLNQMRERMGPGMVMKNNVRLESEVTVSQEKKKIHEGRDLTSSLGCSSDGLVEKWLKESS